MILDQNKRLRSSEPGSSETKPVYGQKSTKKVMALIFWDARDILGELFSN